MKTGPANPRPRGRPKGKRSTQRSRMLSAARDLLVGEAPQELSLGQVARAAGVTPALANYYFGSRDGLIQALFKEQLSAGVNELLVAARARAHQPQRLV